jgi:hypothetical protein
LKKNNFISLVIIASLFQITAIGQKVNGTYKCGSEFLRFHKDTVTFSFAEGVCIVSTYEASGQYFIKNNHLLIKPFIDTFEERIVKTKRQYNDSILFEFLSNNNDSIYPSVIFYNIKKESIRGVIIGRTQKSYLTGKLLELTDSINIGYAGYIPVGFKLKKDFDYKIFLQEGKVKSDYEYILNSKKNGFKIKIKPDRILLKRRNNSCKLNSFYWQTFILQ